VHQHDDLRVGNGSRTGHDDLAVEQRQDVPLEIDHLP
jgi:hypothetical protein